MTWFKVDDAFWAHPKTLALSDSALALWLRAGSYCAQQLTDGHVRREALLMLRGNEFAADDLVDAELWHETKDGYVFHDWEKYQPTRAKVEAERDAWRERQNRHRGIASDVTRDSPRESQSPVPFPSRPESPKGDSSSALDLVVESTFEQVWAQWPRKNSKKAAAAKFAIAAKAHPAGTRGLAADVIEHARAYERFGHDPQFVPYLATWLNKQLWNDPLPGPRSSASSQQSQNASVLGRYMNGDQP